MTRSASAHQVVLTSWTVRAAARGQPISARGGRTRPPSLNRASASRSGRTFGIPNKVAAVPSTPSKVAAGPSIPSKVAAGPSIPSKVAAGPSNRRHPDSTDCTQRQPNTRDNCSCYRRNRRNMGRCSHSTHTAGWRDCKGQSDPTPAINSVALAGAYVYMREHMRRRRAAAKAARVLDPDGRG